MPVVPLSKAASSPQNYEIPLNELLWYDSTVLGLMHRQRRSERHAESPRTA
jgi:hypothetical protein